MNGIEYKLLDLMTFSRVRWDSTPERSRVNYYIRYSYSMTFDPSWIRFKLDPFLAGYKAKVTKHGDGDSHSVDVVV